jgi:predicted DNA-binding transcriptional regulator
MTTINIIRPEVTDNFTSLPNQLLGYGRHIKGLKPRDSAVLNYLLSKPPHWKIIAKEITLALNISINTVYAALTVLQRLGIASYTRDKFGHTRWIVSIASNLYSPVIPPHTKIPHQEICEVLENNDKSEIIIKTTTRCVSEGDLGAADTPSDYINEPQIAPAELIGKSVLVPLEIEKIIEPEIINETSVVIETVETATTAVEIVVETPVTDTPAEIELPEQLTEVEKLVAKKSITKADLDTTTYAVIMLALKAALTTGVVRSPIAYLNGLINKAKEGTLDASNYNELQTKKCQLNRSDEIRNLFAKHGDAILLELVTNGAIHVKPLGLVQYDEVKKLGLVNDVWTKKYADIQLQKMTKLTPNKPTVTTIKKKPSSTMSAEEFEAKRQAQIEMAMAMLNNS